MPKKYVEAMAPKKRKITASRHLVCGNCRSWIQFESSGCGKTWAETRGKGFEFTCKGCTEVTALVKEVEGLKQMVEDIMEKVAGLRVEDKGEETGSSVTMTGVNQDGEVQARDEAAGITRTEETITGVEDEGEIRTEETITGVEDEGEIRTEEAITGVVGKYRFWRIHAHAHENAPEIQPRTWLISGALSFPNHARG